MIFAPVDHMCYKLIYGYYDTERRLDSVQRTQGPCCVSGRTIGDLVNEAIRSYLSRPELLPKRGSLAELIPERYPRGSEHLREEIDKNSRWETNP
jgi:hypothetical protein